MGCNASVPSSPPNQTAKLSPLPPPSPPQHQQLQSQSPPVPAPAPPPPPNDDDDDNMDDGDDNNYDVYMPSRDIMPQQQQQQQQSTPLSHPVTPPPSSPPPPPPSSSSWNDNFQDILEMPELSDAQLQRKYEVMAKVSTDFVATAQMYGRVIIAEYYLPDSAKTIKPSTAMGGVAGGTKYIINGIMFKLAQDKRVGSSRFVYGGVSNEPCVEGAMKAAAHDLIGCTTFLNHSMKLRDPHTKAIRHEALRCPLQALVDYHGERLIAMPVLPLQCIEFGSPDAGRTLHTKDAHGMMAAAGAALHLAPHGVRGHDAGKRVFAAVDVEVHVGVDGRRYLLDLARAQPCEDPQATGHLSRTQINTIFYRLLRPELLQILKSQGMPALSSDAWSTFGVTDYDDGDEGRRHNEHVTEATAYLCGTLVRNYARELDSVVADYQRRVAMPKLISVVQTYTEVPNVSVNATHRWSMYLKCASQRQQAPQRGDGDDGDDDGDDDGGMSAIEKVEYMLHPTFRPNHVVVDDPPFALSPRTGWGKFQVRVRIHFKANRQRPPIVVNHYLKFLSGQPLCTTTAHIAEASNVRQQHQRAITELTHRLLSVEHFSKHVHSRGINVRHCGLLRSWIKVNETAKTTILVVMVGRTLKQLLRQRLRDAVRRYAAQHRLMPSQFDLHTIVAEFFNLITQSDDEDGVVFWRDTVTTSLQQRFGDVALDAGMECTHLSRVMASKVQRIVMYVAGHVGVQLAAECAASVTHGFRFSVGDIVHLEERLKFMSVCDYARGKFFLSLCAPSTPSPPAAAVATATANAAATKPRKDVAAAERVRRRRLCDLATASFDRALQSDSLNSLAVRDRLVSMVLSSELDGSRYEDADELLATVTRGGAGAAINVSPHHTAVGAFDDGLMKMVIHEIVHLWRTRPARCHNFSAHCTIKGMILLKGTLKLMQTTAFNIFSASLQRSCTTFFQHMLPLLTGDGDGGSGQRRLNDYVSEGWLSAMMNPEVAPSDSERLDRISATIARITGNVYDRTRADTAIIECATQCVMAKDDKDDDDDDDCERSGDWSLMNVGMSFYSRSRVEFRRQVARRACVIGYSGVLEDILSSSATATSLALASMSASLPPLSTTRSSTSSPSFVASSSSAAAAAAMLTGSDSGGDSLLHVATTHASLKCVRLLVAKKASLEARNHQGRTPLHCAAAIADTSGSEVCDALIRAGADIEATTSDGMTAMMCAAAAGAIQCVMVLAEKGASLNAVDMEHAIINGHVDVARFLFHLTLADDIAVPTSTDTFAEYAWPFILFSNRRELLSDTCGDNDTCLTPPMWAARKGQVKVIEALCAYVNYQRWVDDMLATVNPADGCTLLHYATEGAHIAMVRWLLDKKCVAAARTKNTRQETPIMVAARLGHCDICALLLEYSTSSSSSSSSSLADEQTPPRQQQRHDDDDDELYTCVCAALGNNHIEVARLLLPAITVLSEEHASSLLLRAAAEWSMDALMVCIDKCAAVRSLRHVSVNVLIAAAKRSGGGDHLAVLLKHHPNADIDTVNERGECLLHVVALRDDSGGGGMYAMNVNLRDNEGRTPLMVFAERGDIDGVGNLLTFHRINVTAVDYDNRTVVDRLTHLMSSSSSKGDDGDDDEHSNRLVSVMRMIQGHGRRGFVKTGISAAAVAAAAAARNRSTKLVV